MQKFEADNKTVKYNCGISILKIWMVMSVVVCHFLDRETAPKLSYLFTFYYAWPAVPVLVFISFLLTNIADERNITKVLRRLYRLVLPHCFFTVFYFVVYSLVPTPTATMAEMTEGGAKSLLKQLLSGGYLDPPMWFVVDLIILSILFYGVFLLLRDAERGIIAVIIIAGAAIYAQYSGINYKVFGDLPYYSKWTFGRLVELVPVAVLGIILSHYKIINKLVQHRKVALTISMIGLLLFHYTPLFYSCEGFGYQGLSLVWISVCMGIFFWLLPLEYLPVQIRAFFNRWASYNMGVIAMHYMIKAFFEIILSNMRLLSIQESIMIYVISLLVTIIATHIPIKLVKDAFI